MARRKNKQTRKYEPRDEFRVNYSKWANGHPNYIFGYKNGKYKSWGLTTEPNDPNPKIKLSKNPNPNDSTDSYLKLTKPFSGKTSYYGPLLENWSFADVDKSIVRHRKKQYKKSYNRGHKKRR